jgi:hypothetical protein
MTTSRWPRIFVSFAFAVVISTCATVQPTPATPTPLPTATSVPVTIADPTGMAPEEVVKTFYTWYIEGWYSQNPEHMLPDAYKQTGYLTDELTQKIDQAREEMRQSGPGYDPILYAQDVPQHVRVEQVDVQGGQATVLISSSFPGHFLEITLQQANDTWVIAGIQRSASPSEGSATIPPSQAESASDAESASTPAPYNESTFANWQIYRNDTFGVQVAYPPDWMYEEVTADPSAPPIGAPDVKMIVYFYPQEWGLTTPFNLELTEGSWEEYRASHIEPNRSEMVELNGYPATFELEQVTDEITILRYLIENPTDKEWRATFIDYVSGFPERVQGNEAYVELFRQMMQTFEFIR